MLFEEIERFPLFLCDTPVGRSLCLHELTSDGQRSEKIYKK